MSYILPTGLLSYCSGVYDKDTDTFTENIEDAIDCCIKECKNYVNPRFKKDCEDVCREYERKEMEGIMQCVKSLCPGILCTEEDVVSCCANTQESKDSQVSVKNCKLLYGKYSNKTMEMIDTTYFTYKNINYGCIIILIIFFAYAFRKLIFFRNNA
jgi:hypothetical protein